MFFDDVKNDFTAKLHAGEHNPCPCCGRYAQVYRRTIHKNLIVFMFAMRQAQKDAEGYVDVPDLLRRFRAARDFCILKYWELIEQRPNHDEKIRTSGKYRLTLTGELFLEGRLRLPKFALVFDDKAIGFSSELVGLKDIAGEQFDYSELVA